MKHIVSALFIATLALVALSGIAAAHAKVDRCKPEVGSTNATAPTEVRCWFTEELDTKQSTLSVTDSNNQRVDNNDAKVDLDDKEHKQVVATVKALSQGVYKVSWRVLTPDDNATTEGEWFFGVGQVTVPQSSTSSAPTTPSTPGESPALNTVPDSGRTYIVAALVIGAALGIAWIARRVIK